MDRKIEICIFTYVCVYVHIKNYVEIIFKYFLCFEIPIFVFRYFFSIKHFILQWF